MEIRRREKLCFGKYTIQYTCLVWFENYFFFLYFYARASQEIYVLKRFRIRYFTARLFSVQAHATNAPTVNENLIFNIVTLIVYIKFLIYITTFVGSYIVCNQYMLNRVLKLCHKIIVNNVNLCNKSKNIQ